MPRSAWIPVGSFALALLLSQLTGTPSRGLLARQATHPSCPDPITLPVCVRPVRPKNKDDRGGTRMDFSAETLKGIQDGMSGVWARCCVFFIVTLGDAVELPPGAYKKGKLPVANSDGQTITPNRGLTKLFENHNSPKCLNLYYAGDVVAGGLPAGQDLKGTALNNDNGMIVDDNASGALNAHEAGHNLGLEDNGDPSNLMGGKDTNGHPPTALTDAQCAIARGRAKRYLQAFAQ